MKLASGKIAMPNPVRAARAYDAASIAALAGELGYPATRTAILARLAGVEADSGATVLVVEDLEGQVAGWIHVAARAQLTEDLTAEILGLVVTKSARGHGLGERLLAAAEAWAREHGCFRIRVRSATPRERAHRFYEARGYARIKTQLVLARALSSANAP